MKSNESAWCVSWRNPTGPSPRSWTIEFLPWCLPQNLPQSSFAISAAIRVQNTKATILPFPISFYQTQWRVALRVFDRFSMSPLSRDSHIIVISLVFQPGCWNLSSQMTNSRHPTRWYTPVLSVFWRIKAFFLLLPEVEMLTSRTFGWDALHSLVIKFHSRMNWLYV